MHGVCGLDYYYQAIKYMTEKSVKPVFFIFSDNMQWVQDNMAIDFPCHYLKHNSTATTFQALRLMSPCQHHVVANSSFSWWAAWLNPSVEKMVIRPKIWFAGLSQASAWACPQEWRTSRPRSLKCSEWTGGIKSKSTTVSFVRRTFAWGKADLSTARAELGWRHTVDVDAVIVRMCEAAWHRGS